MKKFIFLVMVIIAVTGCYKNNNNYLKEEFQNKKLEKFTEEQIVLLDLHNQERASRGYSPLLLDEKLCDYAKDHAKNMSLKEWLYHSNMDDLRKVDPQSTWIGENIAWGQENEKQVVKDWMWSTGHRWNILGSKYKKVGFGIEKDSKGRIYWCAVFSS